MARTPKAATAATPAAAPESTPDLSVATVKRKDLADALAIVAPVAKRAEEIPVLSGVLIETGGARLRLSCCDLDRRITTHIDCDGALGRAVVVNATLFAAVAKAMAGEHISLLIDGDALVLTARNGGTRRLPVLPAEDFPDLSAAEPAAVAIVARDLLEKAIANVAPAQSTEETRYYLNGILFEALPGENGQDLRLVATDGHRLHFDRIETPELTGDWPAGPIVPRQTIAALLATSKAAGDDVTEIRIEISDRHVEAVIGDVSLWSKLIDGSFPDYRRIIPGALPVDFECPAAELDRAVAALQPLGVKTRAVALRLDTGGSRVEISVPENGTGSEPIDDAQLRGADSLSVGFNAKYLRETLKLFGAERVTFELVDEIGSVRISSPAQPGLTVVLMPMRI